MEVEPHVAPSTLPGSAEDIARLDATTGDAEGTQEDEAGEAISLADTPGSRWGTGEVTITDVQFLSETASLPLCSSPAGP